MVADCGVRGLDGACLPYLADPPPQRSLRGRTQGLIPCCQYLPILHLTNLPLKLPKLQFQRRRLRQTPILTRLPLPTPPLLPPHHIHLRNTGFMQHPLLLPPLPLRLLPQLLVLRPLLLDIPQQRPLLPQPTAFLCFAGQFRLNLLLQRGYLQLQPLLLDCPQSVLVLLLLPFRVFQSLQWRFGGGIGGGQTERVGVVVFGHGAAGFGEEVGGLRFVVAGDGLDVEVPLRVLAYFGADLADGLFEILVDDFNLVVDAFAFAGAVRGRWSLLEVDTGTQLALLLH